jgi:hypothetical protein
LLAAKNPEINAEPQGDDKKHGEESALPWFGMKRIKKQTEVDSD